MKKRSLTTMALSLVMATMAISAPACAHHTHKKHERGEHQTQKAIVKLAIENALLEAINVQMKVFAYEGALAQANSSTDTEYLTTLIARYTQFLSRISDRFTDKLKLPHRIENNINTLAAAFFATSFEYANQVRLNDPDQVASAEAMVTLSTTLGQLIGRLINDPTIAGLFSDIAIRETQNVQAWGGVLVNGPIQPGDSASEATAVVAIDADIVKLVKEIAGRIANAVQ